MLIPRLDLIALAVSANLRSVAVSDGLGNWFQCIPAIPDFREQCQLEDTHMSVGASGYYPITDRRYDYWINIGTVAPGGAAVTSIMALLLKPTADDAVLASRPSTSPVAAEEKAARRGAADRAVAALLQELDV